jgi:hypothetical protein
VPARLAVWLVAALTPPRDAWSFLMFETGVAGVVLKGEI